jgi:hypothetical protein
MSKFFEYLGVERNLTVGWSLLQHWYTLEY